MRTSQQTACSAAAALSRPEVFVPEGEQAQDNSHDCGLYAATYVHGVIEDLTDRQRVYCNLAPRPVFPLARIAHLVDAVLVLVLCHELRVLDAPAVLAQSRAEYMRSCWQSTRVSPLSTRCAMCIAGLPGAWFNPVILLPR